MRHLAPVNLHGDGGRTYSKKELLILQFEPVFGRGTSKQPDSTSTGGANDLGHSMESRFCFAVVRWRVYKDDWSPVTRLLEHWSKFWADLYDTGIDCDGTTFKFLPIGLKGDLPWISKAASLNRTFGNIRKRAPNEKSKGLVGCCWLCHAGQPGLPFEDLRLDPTWSKTEFENNEAPWDECPSILKFIPCEEDALLPQFFRMDLFHILQMGVCKDFAGSSMVLILPLFSEGSFERNLAAMNAKLPTFARPINCTWTAKG